MPSRHPDDLHRRLVTARTQSARMQVTPPVAAAPNHDSRHVPSNYSVPSNYPVFGHTNGRPGRNRGARRQRHNMQLTQPSTSVPSNAIWRMRM